VGVCAAVFAVEPRGQRLSRARSADSLQRGSLHCADRQPVAFHTARLPAVAGDYQQMQCWMRAGCFERLVEDTRILRREFAGRKGQPTAVCIDSRTLQSTPESGACAGYDGAKRRKGSKVHIAVDTLGHLLALRVTAADQGDRAQVETLTEDMQAITGGTVEMAFVDQGYTGPNAAETGTEPRHPARRGQAPAGQAWLRAAAAPLGCREKLRLDRQISPTRKRLSTTRHYPQRFPPHRLRLPHDRKHLQTTCLNFITAHRACRQSG